MISAAEITLSLRGAGRLALRDQSGLAYLNASIEGFWRSFTAALLVYPAYLILIATRPESPVEAGTGFLLVETIAYVIGWFAFPLAMFHLTELLGRAERFLAYIVAVNWCNVIQAWLIATIALLGTADLLPDGMARFLSFVAFIWTLSYHWFVARSILEVNGFTAAGIVALDVVLSLFIMSITQHIERV